MARYCRGCGKEHQGAARSYCPACEEKLESMRRDNYLDDVPPRRSSFWGVTDRLGRKELPRIGGRKYGE